MPICPSTESQGSLDVTMQPSLQSWGQEYPPGSLAQLSKESEHRKAQAVIAW